LICLGHIKEKVKVLSAGGRRLPDRETEIKKQEEYNPEYEVTYLA